MVVSQGGWALILTRSCLSLPSILYMNIPHRDAFQVIFAGDMIPKTGIFMTRYQASLTSLAGQINSPPSLPVKIPCTS